MKLYTREQMIEAFNYGQNLKGFDWIGDMIDSLTPIELPSDEEIEETFTFFPQIIEGAKWMKKQILNQNK